VSRVLQGGARFARAAGAWGNDNLISNITDERAIKDGEREGVRVKEGVCKHWRGTVKELEKDFSMILQGMFKSFETGNVHGIIEL